MQIQHSHSYHLATKLGACLLTGLLAASAPFTVFADPSASNNPARNNQGLQSTIKGNPDEQPLELYIISWPDPEPMTSENPPVRLIVDEPEPVDPAVFQREIEYFEALQGLNAPAPATPGGG